MRIRFKALKKLEFLFVGTNFFAFFVDKYLWITLIIMEYPTYFRKS
jgi:hypothetical protein